MTIYAHKLIAETAREMAKAVYEECASNNAWYAANPSRRNFVRHAAPTLIQQARETLTDMLQQPDVSEAQKAEIMDALVQDRSIPRGAGTRVH